MDGGSGSGSADQQHRFQSAHQLYLARKKSFRNIDIPPRKLLSHRFSEPYSMDMYHFNNSPRVHPDEIVFQKFLPHNSHVVDDADDEDDDPYASDHFRMYEFKIRKCTRSRSHDWTDCPFAHPGEKARRRCPRRFNYSGAVCPDYRRGSCGRGDACDFAHGVFETWLHPSRYRTEACKDGRNCGRKVCFFAHTPGQLRTLTPPENAHKHVNSSHCANCHCHPHPGVHHTTSPTSILDMEKLSPPSPAFPPAQPVAGFSPVSRFSDKLTRAEASGSGSSYKDSKKEKLMTRQEMIDLMNSMNAMNMNAIEQQAAPNKNIVWKDSFAGNDDQQSLFTPSTHSPMASGSSRGFPNRGMNNRNEVGFVNECSAAGPDIDWVNDLLT